MRLCTTHLVGQRTWTVELRPERGGPTLYCPQCPPGTPPVRAAAPQALAHLARHARRDALPQHLRTCQCDARGCSWHPRHRGCAGPVLLVLTREHGGRLWRLADVCAACAAATTHAAVVPDTALPASSATRTAPTRNRARSRREHRGPSEQVRVREMLSYLAAALPTQTTAAARLLALQCALRSNAAGYVHIPTGLLRGMRLDFHTTTPHKELRDAHWLHYPARPGTGRAGFTAQLLDAAVRTQAPARRDRARAADWALRTCPAARFRPLGPLPRLLALVLTAHLPAGSPQAPVLAEGDLLARMRGLNPPELVHVLDLLVDTDFLQSWAYGPNPEDVQWEFALPDPFPFSQGPGRRACAGIPVPGTV
ncbi:hypothetical protein OH809_38560 [Streptomyces sp. NBC_00873]|uniref:hypothetical protein n=1 Tax=Streptomyces sp. NBC_00873 TaxID=2975852 RepID=UPI0038673466|nr:hypothetical protein OH809_38560 [Streptomyces sp. NBC_00873]